MHEKDIIEMLKKVHNPPYEYKDHTLFSNYLIEEFLGKLLKKRNTYLEFVMDFWRSRFYIGIKIENLNDIIKVDCDTATKMEKEICRVFDLLLYSGEEISYINETFDYTAQEEAANY